MVFSFERGIKGPVMSSGDRKGGSIQFRVGLILDFLKPSILKRGDVWLGHDMILQALWGCKCHFACLSKPAIRKSGYRILSARSYK